MLLEDLAQSRDERNKNLFKDWTGPIAYDPLDFFSVFRVLFTSGFTSYSITVAPLILVIMFSILCTLVITSWMPSNAPRAIDALISLQPMGGMLGGTVSILLAFRLARAAVRFYDSRAAAGKLVEICRVAASEMVLCADHDHAARDAFLRWTVAVPVAVKNHLRGERGTPGDLTGILPSAALAALAAAPHQPLHCLHRMRAIARRAALSSPVDPRIVAAAYRGLSVSVDTLIAAMGGMERISLTPLPFSYTAHIRVLILVYLFFLVAAFSGTWGWLTPPCVGVVGFLLLGTGCAPAHAQRPTPVVSDPPCLSSAPRARLRPPVLISEPPCRPAVLRPCL